MVFCDEIVCEYSEGNGLVFIDGVIENWYLVVFKIQVFVVFVGWYGNIDVEFFFCDGKKISEKSFWGLGFQRFQSLWRSIQ